MTPLAPDARVVVIGTGQGGFQVAASLRQEGFAGPVTLIGEEPGLPYQRPPLSKAYMADGEAERLLLKPAGFYDRSALTLVEARATGIDRETRVVQTEGGAAHPYDHLVLATGARAFRPPVPGLDADEVVELRTLADAALLRDRLARTRHAIVVGGGFIGLEFAAMARAAGVAVTVLETAPRLMARALSPAMSDWFLAAHRAMGTEVLLGACVEAVENGRGVRLTDGRMVAGDLVLAATGVRPNAELAAAAGLTVENGVVVDGRLLTSDPAISALGDCAAFPLPEGGRVRLESVQAAVDHARHIARRLAKGEEADYAAVPWFWSDQGKHKLQIAGLGTGAEEVVALPQAEGQAVVLLFRAGRLAAVETVNAVPQHMAARKLIGAPQALLEAAGYDLKDALKTGAA
ncbi:FAD-dependent oxidoreductase [Haematobacter massiliensis]|uniref:Pyridine nucleotide-disulfide oxidoreductase n=1 Tax=Haematobacter massiliensis TaxID=195105 RepID=A0A086Y6M8_9RHOB|nr:FAD-dependent oxidoreductase [Haematobacter massiliensis]KFI29928.1 pyridine nucleotide-disulfide oxidoreductase [Haematobacter massiliensis]OWJ72934.1 FAD-dependent oxidoreductase [Haematobacter massiliensis]OWJ81405.1 FAD-dependent oxidoreductase [Haematobacter massiliensis]QBJ25435.1 FAD-dependent oxidoreductase [Haematobacter massiliensis]